MKTSLIFQEASICEQFRRASAAPGPTIIRELHETDTTLSFASSVAAGLASRPRALECRYLYDHRGSELFDLITRQPEYYLTRTETAILSAHARRIREITGAVSLIELGSGSSTKTDLLLQAWLESPGKVHYVPVDVSESALVGASSNIASRHPRVKITAVNSEYATAFPLFRELSPTLVILLGSTIGNFSDDEMHTFLAALAASLQQGDFFLLGVDLVKAPALLEAAYNDAAGVTAEFTSNLFARMNRELGSSIDLHAVQHVARYNREAERVEIEALFTREQTVFVEPLGTRYTLEAGETVRVEISRKFRLGHLRRYLTNFGFEVSEVLTDEREWFALLLLRRGGKVVRSSN